ncbi:hypothetical protein [Streptomyces sp. NPDC005859]
MPRLLPDVRCGFFDRAIPVAELPDGYRAMADRSSLKVRVSF